MTAETIRKHLDWLRSMDADYVDDPHLGARRWYLELVGKYLVGAK